MIQKSDYNFNLMPHSPDRTGCPLKTNAQAMTAVSPLVTAHVFHNHEEVKQNQYTYSTKCRIGHSTPLLISSIVNIETETMKIN